VVADSLIQRVALESGLVRLDGFLVPAKSIKGGGSLIECLWVVGKALEKDVGRRQRVLMLGCQILAGRQASVGGLERLPVLLAVGILKVIGQLLERGDSLIIALGVAQHLRQTEACSRRVRLELRPALICCDGVIETSLLLTPRTQMLPRLGV